MFIFGGVEHQIQVTSHHLKNLLHPTFPEY